MENRKQRDSVWLKRRSIASDWCSAKLRSLGEQCMFQVPFVSGSNPERHNYLSKNELCTVRNKQTPEILWTIALLDGSNTALAKNENETSGSSDRQ